MPLFSLHIKHNPSTSCIRNFKPLAILCGCTARFVSDLIRNPKTGFLTTRLICQKLRNCTDPLHGVQRRMISVDNFFFCCVVAICDLVHDVETIFHLSYVLTASGNLF